MMKMRKLQKARVWRTFAKFLYILRLTIFLWTQNGQKKLGLWIFWQYFFEFFFVNVVNIELQSICKTYLCVKSRTALIWLPDLVIKFDVRDQLTILCVPFPISDSHMFNCYGWTIEHNCMDTVFIHVTDL